MGKGKGQMQKAKKALIKLDQAAQKQKRIQQAYEARQKEKREMSAKLARDKAKTPFLPTQRILLVGEGNFSFARALTELFQRQLQPVDAAGAAGPTESDDPAVTASNAAAAAETDIDVDGRADSDDDGDDGDDDDNHIGDDSDDVPEEEDIDAANTVRSAVGAQPPVTAAASAAAASAPARMVGALLVATCLDSEQVLHQKYDDAQRHLDELAACGARMLFEGSVLWCLFIFSMCWICVDEMSEEIDVIAHGHATISQG
jgi:hypothetical protein